MTFILFDTYAFIVYGGCWLQDVFICSLLLTFYPSTLTLMSLRLLCPTFALPLYPLELAWLVVSPYKVVVYKLEQPMSPKLHSLRLLCLGVWSCTLLTYITFVFFLCHTHAITFMYCPFVLSRTSNNGQFPVNLSLGPCCLPTMYQPFSTCSCR